MKTLSIKLLLVLTVLRMPMVLFAAGGTVTGKITEAGTNDVLPGANVTIEGTRMGAASGTNGVYSISNVPTGTHTLVVSFMGYKPVEEEVTVSEGATATVNFVLESEILTGKEISIKDLALTIKDSLGFKGDIYFNTEKPDGTMRKLTNVNLLNGLGFKHTIDLEQGIEFMYNAYLSKQS